MKKFLLFLGMLLSLIMVDLDVGAYINCVPPSCPVGYQFNGTTCSGSTCVTQCITYECTMQWTQEHSDTQVGWQSQDSPREYDHSTAYETTNSSNCYRFRYEGPPSADSNIKLNALSHPTWDCDTQGIGGFSKVVVQPESLILGLTVWGTILEMLEMATFDT